MDVSAGVRPRNFACERLLVLDTLNAPCPFFCKSACRAEIAGLQVFSGCTIPRCRQRSRGAGTPIFKEIAGRSAGGGLARFRCSGREAACAPPSGAPAGDLRAASASTFRIASSRARHSLAMLLPSKPPQGTDKFATVLLQEAKRLHAMDRYERRALSRRKFAIRALDAERRREMRSIGL